MIPEFGHFALILALCTALVQGTLPLLGAQYGRADWMALARPAAQVLAWLLLIAFGCLTAAFVLNDFSVACVAQHSNTRLPLPYRVAGVWGGHEGSLLLWVTMLGLWGGAVARGTQRLPVAMAARVIGVLGLVMAGFLAFTLFASNPFVRLLPAAAEGRELNPLLQDPGLILHPPMLYMGYAGFSVAYAFALAALLAGRLDMVWAHGSRPWTLAAWAFLTVGIALGSRWAYYELGWGGWWFWDPVENAALMPWLAGTALLHSLAVTEKSGGFRNWTVLLAISTFSLALLGAFLVRSGVLSSVHAFAIDPRRGVFILALLVILTGSALALFAWRARKTGSAGGFAPCSRESLLLINNVLLTAACGSVLLGTLYPLLADTLGWGKISVGPPYFEAVFVPLMMPALFLIGVSPWVRWKRTRAADLARALCAPLAASAVFALTASLLAARLGGGGAPWKPWVALGMLLAAWIVMTALLDIVRRFRAMRAVGAAHAAHTGRLALPAAFLGMHLAHMGVAVFVVGVALVNGYQIEREVRLTPGERVALAGYEFRFQGVRQVPGENYQTLAGAVDLLRHGLVFRRLAPEKRFYPASGMWMTEAAIDSGWLRDVYVSLDEPVERGQIDGAWVLRIQYKPFVNWIWGGCVLMALGGLLAIRDRRHRVGGEPRCPRKTRAGGR